MQEAIRTPSNPIEAIEKIRKQSLAYLEDGSDREAEDIELGQRFNLDITKIKSLWAKARKDRAEPLTEVRLPPRPKEAEDFFGPKREPKPKEAQSAPPPNRPTDPKPDREPEEEEEPKKAAINRTPWAAAKAEPPKAVAETDVDEVARLEAELAEKKALVEVNQRPPHLVTPGMAAQKPAVALKEINKQHAVITNLGGKCVVMEWVPSPIDLRWEEPSYQSTTSFRERYANRYVEIITDVSSKVQRLGAEPLAPWWLCQPGRRQYDGVGLVPNGPHVLPGNRLNLWRGWGVEPGEGDWSLLRHHLHVVLANERRNQRTTFFVGQLGNFRTQESGRKRR